MKKRRGCCSGLIVLGLLVAGIVFISGTVDLDDVLDIFDSGHDYTSNTTYNYEEAAAEPAMDTTEADEYTVEYVSIPPKRQPYYPLSDCAASRLFVGDRAFVSLGGGSNGIRSEPDTHPSDNIIGRAPSGEGMLILDGPVCNYGWILWKVKTDSGLVGWTPETKDGKEFWLVPVDSPGDVASEFEDDPDKQTAYQQASQIMADTRLSDSDKREKMRVLQNTYGEEVVAWVMRYVPVYSTDDNKFHSFDSYMQDFSEQYGSSQSGSPIEQDPVGAGLKIFFDPSEETITEMLGLDDW